MRRRFVVGIQLNILRTKLSHFRIDLVMAGFIPAMTDERLMAANSRHCDERSREEIPSLFYGFWIASPRSQ
ncbi:MAG: hypothetical protein J0H71_02835 [Rhizobiales bacterium]|nr:hypothetical protein [Hyphomicrobiales bacterium]